MTHLDETADLQRRFGGLERLYGVLGAASIRSAHVAVVGIGGVGSWAAEALARSGVGELTLIDLDHIAESNINRQLHALAGTLGQAKVQAMRERPDLYHTQIEETNGERVFIRGKTRLPFEREFYDAEAKIESMDRVDKFLMGRVTELREQVRKSDQAVEDYRRTALRGIEPAFLDGGVAIDVTHILAELIENALRHSAAEATIDVHDAHRLGAVAGQLDAGQDEQRLGVPPHAGREVVEAEQVLERVGVLLGPLQVVDERHFVLFAQRRFFLRLRLHGGVTE